MGDVTGLCLRIKVSFWGSGTLKIVIYVENHPQKRSFRLAEYHPLLVGVLISEYIYIGLKSGRHDSPHIQKSSLDHDSGEKKYRGVTHIFRYIPR